MIQFNGEAARHEWSEFAEKFVAMGAIREDGMKHWRTR